MGKNQVIQEQKIIDNIKALAIDMIDKANSGHPGIVLSAATTLYTLYTKHMKINPSDDRWINRDRFVISAGHGSALLYAILFMAGFNLTIDDLKNFRSINSKTPGHPEYGITPGVDITTGPLGQGLASAVGLAIAERYLNSKYNLKKQKLLDKDLNLFNYYTYVLCSDGDIMEGVVQEAASLAGHLKLNKLIVLYDSNNVSLDGNTELVFSENVIERFKALDWDIQVVKDGENIKEIDRAISKAKKTDKPSLIKVNTILGKESLIAGTNKVHGGPLSQEDLVQLKEKWGIRNIPFAVSKEATEEIRNKINYRCKSFYEKWLEDYKIYMDKVSDEVKQEISYLNSHHSTIDIDLPNVMWRFDSEMKEQMRETNGKIMDVISDKCFNFIGGNADLSSSTKAVLKNKGIFSSKLYNGRNIYFGVREHAMGAILNGLALSGLKPFGGTFLAFADYLKPAIRMATLMNIPVTYIFTHDSINIGQDGPTHQPIEQLAMLRSTPNLDVFRPADGNEIVGAWDTILQNTNPSALILSRNQVSLLSNSKSEEVVKGAYIIKKEKSRLTGIIIATGSEVELALKVADNLLSKGIDLRVISMPCVERFLVQPFEYKEELIPIGYKTVVIEAGSSNGWHRFVYNDKYLITINTFGKSGTEDQLLKAYGFDIDTLTIKIEKLFK